MSSLLGYKRHILFLPMQISAIQSFFSDILYEIHEISGNQKNLDQFLALSDVQIFSLSDIVFPLLLSSTFLMEKYPFQFDSETPHLFSIFLSQEDFSSELILFKDSYLDSLSTPVSKTYKPLLTQPKHTINQ